jgi:Ca2+-transporting ATPase
MDPPKEQVWHAESIDACLAAAHSQLDGLASQEADARLLRDGPNLLQSEAPPSVLRRLLRQFNNVLLYVLMIAAVLTGSLGHWLDTSVIVAAVLINAIVGFVQEGRAEEAIQAIREMLSTRIVALRNHVRTEVEARDLVVGDVIVLQAGDRVPADVRLFDCRRLEVDQSVLTGESVPAVKDQRAVATSVEMPDRCNMAYAGTVITRGWSRALVIATGEATELGEISGALQSIEGLSTPLLDKISSFARRMSLLILVLSGAVALFGAYVHGYAVADMIIAAVSIAVAAIPEGLPAVITITLAIGVRKMAQRSAIVRRLPAVETLGEVDVICTDKTGTVTANEMTVRLVVTAEGRSEVSGVGYDQEGEISASQGELLLLGVHELAVAGACCNDAHLDNDDGRASVVGDPMEAALIVLAHKAGIDVAQLHAELPRMDMIPFEPEQRFMATLHRLREGHGVVYVKGAPETVLAMCDTEFAAQGGQALRRDYWHEAISALAREGHRVLAFARLELTEQVQRLDDSVRDGHLQLLGITGVMDPPRAEVPRALALCRDAGITVKMITGDHA